MEKPSFAGGNWYELKIRIFVLQYHLLPIHFQQMINDAFEPLFQHIIQILLSHIAQLIGERGEMRPFECWSCAGEQGLGSTKISPEQILHEFSLPMRECRDVLHWMQSTKEFGTIPISLFYTYEAAYTARHLAQPLSVYVQHDRVQVGDSWKLASTLIYSTQTL